MKSCVRLKRATGTPWVGPLYPRALTLVLYWVVDTVHSGPRHPIATTAPRIAARRGQVPSIIEASRRVNWSETKCSLVDEDPCQQDARAGVESLRRHNDLALRDGLLGSEVHAEGVLVAPDGIAARIEA